MAPPLQQCYLYWDHRRHRHCCCHLFLSYLSANHTSKTIAIIVLLKCVLSAIFSPQPSSTSASNCNHHSPPLLAGSNSLSFFVCKGPLLSSLRRALIRSATLNKEGKMERKRGRGRECNASRRMIRRDGAVAETSGCQSIGCEQLQSGCDWGAFDLCLSKGEQREGPSRMIFLSLLAPVPLWQRAITSRLIQHLPS